MAPRAGQVVFHPGGVRCAMAIDVDEVRIQVKAVDGGHRMGSLEDAAAFVFDVDGTLVLSEDPNAGTGVRALDGAAAVLAALRQRGRPFVCFTNGTGQVPAEVAAKLRRVGLDVRDAEMLTPASV